jgi:hypothetical protein
MRAEDAEDGAEGVVFHADLQGQTRCQTQEGGYARLFDGNVRWVGSGRV